MRNSIWLILLWLSPSPGRAANTSDWEILWGGSGYGYCSVQNCLAPISEVSFCIGTASEACNCFTTNTCVCTNQTFINQIGDCIACSCGDEATFDYNSYKANCLLYGGYNLSVGQSVFTSCPGMNGGYPYYYGPRLIQGTATTTSSSEFPLEPTYSPSGPYILTTWSASVPSYSTIGGSPSTAQTAVSSASISITVASTMQILMIGTAFILSTILRF